MKSLLQMIHIILSVGLDVLPLALDISEVHRIFLFLACLPLWGGSLLRSSCGFCVDTWEVSFAFSSSSDVCSGFGSWNSSQPPLPMARQTQTHTSNSWGSWRRLVAKLCVVLLLCWLHCVFRSAQCSCPDAALLETASLPTLCLSAHCLSSESVCLSVCPFVWCQTEQPMHYFFFFLLSFPQV